MALRHSGGVDPTTAILEPLSAMRCCCEGGMLAVETTATVAPGLGALATRFFPDFFSVITPPEPTDQAWLKCVGLVSDGWQLLAAA